MTEALLLLAQQVAPALPGGGQPDLLEARQMQALSLGVHIPLVCFGIAFPAMFQFVEGLYQRTGAETFKRLAVKWSKVALTLFAVGVVTGTILSFEFGLLWPEFMASFGQVFGIAFALEGISFFVEAIFMAIYVYGWQRLSPRAHFLTGVPIVISGFAGSFNVIAVNGWMNDPGGFDVVAGKVADPRPWEAMFNDAMAHEVFHMYLAGYVVAGFIVAGVYSVAWLRGRRDTYVHTALVVALSFACLAAPVRVIVGDWAARSVGERQPVKLAAFEGLAQTTKGASFTLGGVFDEDEQRVRWGIEIPHLLSLLAKHDPNGTITGLDSVPPEDRPPVNVVRFAFQTMVGIGTALALLGAVFFLTWWRRRRLPRSRWFFRAVVAAGPLALVALIAGWIPTEVGRQPWIVYEVMRTEQAVTSADGLEVGYAALVAVYVSLAAAVVWLLRRLASKPPDTEVDEPFGAGFWDLTAGGAQRGGRVRGMIQRSMSPVWEANHVWLIFVLVVVWTAFPVAFASIFSTLSIPLFLAALGIIFRGAAFAFRGQAGTIREARALGAVFASSSVLIPFCFGAAIGGVASGRVEVGNATGEVWSSWLNPTSVLIGALGVVTGAHLAAVFLAADSRRAGQEDLVRAFRARALGSGVAAGALALAGLLVVRSDARDLFDGLTSGIGLACVVVSGAFGIATLA